MTQHDALRQRLLDQQQQLRQTVEERKQAEKTVELDQTRVGRLSRMDAMQMQAMAKAEQGRALLQLKRIAAALKRMDNDEYGDCLECGQAIAEARLAVDPAVPLCIGCAELAAPS